MAKKAHLGRGLSALIPTDPVTENRVETESDANTRPADIFFGGHGHSPKGGSVKELLEPRKNVSRETSKASRKIGVRKAGSQYLLIKHRNLRQSILPVLAMFHVKHR